MLSYKKEFGRHHFDALAGYTLQKKTYDRLGVEAHQFADDRIRGGDGPRFGGHGRQALRHAQGRLGDDVVPDARELRL